jgi:hypothetical protein
MGRAFASSLGAPKLGTSLLLVANCSEKGVKLQPRPAPESVLASVPWLWK